MVSSRFRCTALAVACLLLVVAYRTPRATTAHSPDFSAPKQLGLGDNGPPGPNAPPLPGTCTNQWTAVQPADPTSRAAAASTTGEAVVLRPVRGATPGCALSTLGAPHSAALDLSVDACDAMSASFDAHPRVQLVLAPGSSRCAAMCTDGPWLCFAILESTRAALVKEWRTALSVPRQWRFTLAAVRPYIAPQFLRELRAGGALLWDQSAPASPSHPPFRHGVELGALLFAAACPELVLLLGDDDPLLQALTRNANQSCATRYVYVSDTNVSTAKDALTLSRVNGASSLLWQSFASDASSPTGRTVAGIVARAVSRHAAFVVLGRTTQAPDSTILSNVCVVHTNNTPATGAEARFGVSRRAVSDAPLLHCGANRTAIAAMQAIHDDYLGTVLAAQLLAVVSSKTAVTVARPGHAFHIEHPDNKGQWEAHGVRESAVAEYVRLAPTVPSLHLFLFFGYDVALPVFHRHMGLMEALVARFPEVYHLHWNHAVDADGRLCEHCVLIPDYFDKVHGPPILSGLGLPPRVFGRVSNIPPTGLAQVGRVPLDRFVAIGALGRLAHPAVNVSVWGRNCTAGFP